MSVSHTAPGGSSLNRATSGVEQTLPPLSIPLRILIGCEESGVMRRAFTALGFDAWSCDLQPAADGSNHHIRGDVRDVLKDGWDLLVLAHPPCTRLCNSGVRWLSVPPPGRTLPDMWRELDEGVELFAACWNADIPHVAVENPIMHGHARERMPSSLPRPQIVQPWWFGDQAFKATGFYLRGLPPLVPTDKLTPPKAGTDAHKAWSAVHRASPGPDRAKMRSRTFPGVAEACAAQWGQAILNSRITGDRSPRVVGQSCAGAKLSGASVTSLELPGASVPGLFTGHNSARGRIGDVDEHAATTNQHDADAPIGPFVLAAPQTPGAAGATGHKPGDTHCAVGRSSPA